MDVTFLYPRTGWLFLLLPLLWWVARGRLRPAHLLVRVAICAVLILAIMQPSLIRRSGAAPQVFVVDQRPGLGAAARAEARAALATLLARQDGGRRTLVQLGGAPIAARVDERVTLPAGSLSAALSRALEALPAGSGGAITLVTDGRSTDRHWERQVDALLRRGIAVNTVALSGVPGAAFIGDVATSATRVGERLRVVVAVEGDGRDHQVMLSSNGRPLARSAIFRDQGPTRVALDVPAERAGFVPIRATLSGTAGGVDAVAAIGDPMHVLYLGERQQGAGQQLQRLVGRGFAVERRADSAIGDGSAFARYPLVVLDDLPVARIGAGAQRRLAGAVAGAGTGLLASGGEAAFGPGGYASGPLVAALPVRPRQEEKLEQPTVGLAIVIDTSGSMGGAPLDIAKQVARLTVRKLKASDQVGVVEFYGARQWAVPMQPATQLPDVERTIARMEASGGSTLFPALEEAYYGLKDVDARFRHILVISDGGVEEERYERLLRHIADDRITVSTVRVGSDLSGVRSMAQWAQLGRGRYYAVPDEAGLVAIDFRQPQIKPQPDYRAGSYPVAAASAPAWWQDVGAPPPLAGYTRVAARDQADVLLRADSGDPVLASWQYGAGRVTALATEPLGAGTAGWRGWPAYGRWLARIMAVTARQRPDATVTLTRRFNRLEVAVRRLDGDAGGVPSLRFLTPAGVAIELAATLEQRAPGLYVADVAYPAAQAALVEARDGDTVTRAADRAFSDVAPADAIPADHALPLAALASVSGGRYGEGAGVAALLPPATGGGSTAADLWPWLSLLALVLYLGEIAWRRWPARPSPSHFQERQP